MSLTSEAATRCQNLNHFVKRCKSGRNSRPCILVPRPPKSREQRVNQLDSTGACDYAYFINASNYNVVLRHVRVKVENVERNMSIDTGASVNVINEAKLARTRCCGHRL